MIFNYLCGSFRIIANNQTKFYLGFMLQFLSKVHEFKVFILWMMNNNGFLYGTIAICTVHTSVGDRSRESAFLEGAGAGAGANLSKRV